MLPSKNPVATLLLLGLGLLPLSAAAQPGVDADSAAFITRLGADTLAVERWVRTPGRVEATAVVRSPRATLRRYVLEQTPEGRMERFTEQVLDPEAPERPPQRTEVVERMGDHWMRKVTEGDSTRTESVDADEAALPFLELLSWPYELVLLRHANAAQPVEQPLLAGGRALVFKVERTGDGQVTLTHPFRGPSVARVDASGRMLSLDAAATTRKVGVERVPGSDVAAHARRWAAADRAGRGVGELSGRGQA